MARSYNCEKIKDLVLQNINLSLTSLAIFFLAAGLFTSVTVLAGYEIFLTVPMVFALPVLFNRELLKRKSVIALLLFIAIALLSNLVNYNDLIKPSKSFSKLRYFVVAILSIVPLSFWLKSTSQKTKRIVFGGLCLGMTVASGYTLYQVFFKGVDRAEGLTETMRYGYGTAMTLLIFLNIYLHKFSQKVFFRPILIATFTLAFIGMYLTYTRGALLGFICCVPVVLFFYKRKLAIIIGAIAGVLVLTLAGFYLFGTGNYNSRFLMNKNNGSDQIRRSQWLSAYHAFKERPVLGYGYGNFYSQLKRIKQQYDLPHKEYNNSHSHNILLELAAGTGILGLLAWLGWISMWVIEILKRDNLVKGVYLSYLACFLLAGQFEVLFDANNSTMMMFLFAFFHASDKKTLEVL